MLTILARHLFVLVLGYLLDVQTEAVDSLIRSVWLFFLECLAVVLLAFWWYFFFLLLDWDLLNDFWGREMLAGLNKLLKIFRIDVRQWTAPNGQRHHQVDLVMILTNMVIRSYHPTFISSISRAIPLLGLFVSLFLFRTLELLRIPRTWIQVLLLDFLWFLILFLAKIGAKLSCRLPQILVLFLLIISIIDTCTPRLDMVVITWEETWVYHQRAIIFISEELLEEISRRCSWSSAILRFPILQSIII